jgi:hypothetical protein
MQTIAGGDKVGLAPRRGYLAVYLALGGYLGAWVGVFASVTLVVVAHSATSEVGRSWVLFDGPPLVMAGAGLGGILGIVVVALSMGQRSEADDP